MEFNTEVNKIFGQEMAKLFAQTISEDEMQKKAELVWREMNLPTCDSWNYRKEPEIYRLIKEESLKRLYEKVENILREPIAAEVLEKKARDMIEKARKIGEEAIIKDMARHMVDSTLSVWGRDEQIITEVMNSLRAQER